MKKIILLATAFVLFAIPQIIFAQSSDCQTSTGKKINFTRYTSDEKPDIVETAASVGTFKTLLAAAKAAGLVEALKGDDKITVFAPTDEAFARLPEGTLQMLLKPENKHKLIKILTYHVVGGELTAKDVLRNKRLKTLEGSSVSIRNKSGAAFINGSKLLKTDVFAGNGVIHVIDTVLLPE